MKLRSVLLLVLPVLLVVLLVASPAFAQAPTGGGTPLSAPLGIMLALSTILGVLTNWVQTGKLLGRWITPKEWLPDVTMATTFLLGFVGYEKGLPTPSFDASSLGYAVAAGIGAIIAGVAPTVGTFVHGALNEKLRDGRLARLAAKKAAAAGAAVAALALMVIGCNGALFPMLDTVAKTVLSDLEAGKPDPQIASDVCAVLGGTSVQDQTCANVETVIQDTITTLVDLGLLKGVALTNGRSYQARHAPAAPAASATPSTTGGK